MEKESDILLNSLDNLKTYSGLLYRLYESAYEEDDTDKGDDIINLYDKTHLKERYDIDISEHPYFTDGHGFDSIESANENAHDLYWRLNDLDRVLNKILLEYSIGNPSNFASMLSELDEVMEDEVIFDCLLKNKIEPEHIIKTAYNLFDLTDFDVSFKNGIDSIPKIIRDLSDEIIYKINQYPELLYNIEPRLFEELIFKILKKMKLSPTLTKQTRDGGADIIAFEDNNFTNNKYLIECKRYHTNNKVTVETVRSLYGVKCSLQASKAIIVTTSSYTKPALDFANRHPWELELKDFSDIKKWLKKYWS